MSTLELIGAGFGLASVALTVRASVWCWPVGIVSVIAYAALFFRIKLYADALLQVFFVVTGVMGWAAWHRASPPITTLTRPQRLRVAGILAAGCTISGATFAAFTDASVPYADSAIAGLSITAQVLLMRKTRETWLFWIAVDVLAIGVYLYKDIPVTAGLYAVFLGLAVRGHLAWSTASSSASSSRRTPDTSSSSEAPPLPASG